jgi:hypothetical protein
VTNPGYVVSQDGTADPDGIPVDGPLVPSAIPDVEHVRIMFGIALFAAVLLSILIVQAFQMFL